MNIDNIGKAIDYGAIIIHLAQSEVLTWEEKYDAVFHIYGKMREIGFSFSYYDPDRSYEDDVLALARAIEKEMESWQEIATITEGRLL